MAEYIKFTKPSRKVSRVFIHCSASDNLNHDNIATIKAWHKERGFSAIGYHYFIDKSGKIFLGRDIGIIPAAQHGNNTGSIAICLGGLQIFSQAQFDSLNRLCADINAAYNKQVTFHGHCEVEPLKTCPVFDYKKVLSLDSKGYITTKGKWYEGLQNAINKFRVGNRASSTTN